MDYSKGAQYYCDKISLFIDMLNEVGKTILQNRMKSIDFKKNTISISRFEKYWSFYYNTNSFMDLYDTTFSDSSYNMVDIYGDDTCFIDIHFRDIGNYTIKTSNGYGNTSYNNEHNCLDLESEEMRFQLSTVNSTEEIFFMELFYLMNKNIKQKFYLTLDSFDDMLDELTNVYENIDLCISNNNKGVFDR